jgi:hypothetical protein
MQQNPDKMTGDGQYVCSNVVNCLKIRVKKSSNSSKPKREANPLIAMSILLPHDEIA